MRRILGRSLARPSAIRAATASFTRGSDGIVSRPHVGCIAQSPAFTCLHSQMRLSTSTSESSVASSSNEENLFISAMRHVLSELPKNGLRLADVAERVRIVLGDPAKGDPTTYGYASLVQALVAVNDSHYLVDEVVHACDWERVLMQVRAKLPAAGVLEPAFVRYINAEGCPQFRRGSPTSTKQNEKEAAEEGDEEADESTLSPRQLEIKQIREQLRADNPTRSSLPGVLLNEWVETHFSKIIEVIDVTPPTVIARAAANGAIPNRTYIYKPVEDTHPYVQVLRTAFKCLGCTNPHHMPTQEPLQNIAAIVPLLPTNPKTNAPYTWPEFLQLPEVTDHFETKVSIFVAAQKASQTHLVFVDGTTLHPDEAEAAVHQWRARRSRELAGIPVRVKVIAVRREDDPQHSNEDIIIDGYVVEPAHAILARLALIADTQSLSSDAYTNARMAAGSEASATIATSAGTIADSLGGGSVSTGGWSAVTNGDADGTSSKPTSSPSTSSSSTTIGKALFNPEDEAEASVAAELDGAVSSGSADSDNKGSNGDSGSTADILAAPSSLTNPSGLPLALCASEVIVLVGSKDSREAIDSNLSDINATNHWVRTLLVVGEE